jgi:hypothetical protein
MLLFYYVIMCFHSQQVIKYNEIIYIVTQKLKIDLKIQAISFKIGVRHSTDTDSEFAPFLAFAPFIEGNVSNSFRTILKAFECSR